MIRYQTTFNSPLSPLASRTVLIQWMQAIGYRLASPPFLSSVRFERGSWMGNFGSLDPRKWRAEVQAQFETVDGLTSVSLEWRVTTAGQTTTKADIGFWRQEVEKTCGVCIGISLATDEYQKFASSAQGGDVVRALIFTAMVVLPLVGVWAATASMVYAVVASIGVGSVGYWIFRAPRTLGDVPIPKISDRAGLEDPKAPDS